MQTTFSFEINTPEGNKSFSIESGSSLFIVGPNGSGKTRIAVQIENALGLKAHRISAHRALNLNPNVAKIGEEEARRGLKTGLVSKDAALLHRSGSRWQNKSATSLLNDFDQLIQTLFAEQNNRALTTHNNNRAGDTSKAEAALFEKLKEIFESLFPHIKLNITGDNISIIPKEGEPYVASDMSDGERAAFYLIGQVLCSEDSNILIIDEPELHIHRSILSQLWDKLEAARPDCAFIFITHDLEFSAHRVGKKFIINNYIYPTKWLVEEIPIDIGFNEEITTKILGSRRPILFVEGERSSLDIAIYRNCYPDRTVIACGSCASVIHSVVTFRKNPILTRITQE